MRAWTLVLPLVLAGTRASSACGYFGPLARDMETSFDKCYAEQVRDSRLRMAIGFEACFGANFDRLNTTVAGPYRKKSVDTSAALTHLADAVCSDNEDALNEFILAGDGSLAPGDDPAEGKLDWSPTHVTQCRDFFDAAASALAADNFQVASLMKAQEAKLAGLFPESRTREKIFLVVVNIAKPLAACHQPMQELRVRLIRKYLKRFLMDQIGPTVPSFSGKTLPVVAHPELFVSLAFPDQTEKPKPFDWEAKPSGSISAPHRVFVMQPRASPRLTPAQREAVVAFDVRNAQKPLQQRDAELMAAARSGTITSTQALAMTPTQQFKAGLLSRAQLASAEVISEDHGHKNAPVDIDDFWDEGLRLRRGRFEDRDYDRYRVKGFDVDAKIEELFRG